MINSTSIDLLNLIGSDTTLKRVAQTSGGEYHGACPFCGGQDRFVVQPHHSQGGRWSCRHCSPKWEDAITYVRQRDHLTFQEACAILGLGPATHQPRSSGAISLHLTRPSMPTNTRQDYPALIDEEWQSAARTFVQIAEETLWDKSGERARRYLHEERGLSEGMILAAGLGYNPVDQPATWGQVAVWLPRGIVIPWEIHQRLWNIRIRRPKGDPKYLPPTGVANGLYLADFVEPHETVVMVEGEFDALLISQATSGLPVQSVATGGVGGSRLTRWIVQLAITRRVLVAFDVDDNLAGDKAAEYWLSVLGDKARRWAPTRHDVTDMWKAGEDVRAWVIEGIRSHERDSQLK